MMADSTASSGWTPDLPFPDDVVERHLRLGEDSGWEFKEVQFRGSNVASHQRDSWADSIVAFANSDGGVLLLGVTDAGVVTGMSRQHLDMVERTVREVSADLVKPPVRVRTYRQEQDGRAFLLVAVPSGDAQHDGPNGALQRVGAAKVPLSPDERLRLAQRRGQARFVGFDHQPVGATGFSTLEADLWRPLLSVHGQADPRVGLAKLGMLTREETGEERASVAGVLMCTRRPAEWIPAAEILAVRYRGTDRASGQLDAQTIDGPLDRQVRDALLFVERNIRVSARKTPARENVPEYSLAAVFEAVVNAVVHRDYALRSSRIRLSVFADRLELCSPGSLPNSLSIDSMGERQATRNELLTSVFGRLDASGIDAAGRSYFMERRGDGVTIIRRETQALTGKLPTYRLLDGDELCLTIPAAPPPAESAAPVVTVRGAGLPIEGATVLALFPNKTWKRAVTDAQGDARLELQSAELPMTVFVASEGCVAHLEQGWVPAERALAIELESAPDGGSAVFAESTGFLPGLEGRLNPIRDVHDRTYLYADNVAINEGQQQPVHFSLGNDQLRLEDANGRVLLVTVTAIEGRSSLLDYRRP
ncbi:MAG: putative DNA binding domain-containing protein [bacterium]|nr:putative DNA binding domain-containing protein [bacterium]